MNELDKEEFRVIEQKPVYDDYYSYFLNMLIKVKKSQRCTTEMLSKVFNCSKGTISHFENRIKDFDFVMLFKYAAFFRYKITMNLDKMTYTEVMSL